MYLNDGGSSWTRQTGWLGSSNHCNWEGVDCSPNFSVTDMSLDNNQLSGSFPTDLMSLGSLSSLSTAANSLSGTIPSDVCTKSTSDSLFVYGDAFNCPNDFDSSTGQYLAGCCDSVLIDVDIYLNEFATTVLGDSNCANLAGTESTVCDYMSNKANHDIFASGYPSSFGGDVWAWLKVRRRKRIWIVEFSLKTMTLFHDSILLCS